MTHCVAQRKDRLRRSQCDIESDGNWHRSLGNTEKGTNRMGTSKKLLVLPNHTPE